MEDDDLRSPFTGPTEPIIHGPIRVDRKIGGKDERIEPNRS